MGLHDAETWIFWKLDQKYLETFEMRWWKRMEKISSADHLTNEVLQRVKTDRSILQKNKTKISKAKWTTLSHFAHSA
jgi:hypothetical protein